jgi:F-type H+-transporting ATPase subunit a
MQITPDHAVYWQWGFAHLNATIVYTWAVMLLITMVSWLVTRRLEKADAHRSRWQNALEVGVETARRQIHEMCPKGSDTYLPFVGTLFLFIAVSNMLEIVPGWHAPTSSLSTTSALAICVGVAVPLFGILRQGVAGYFRHYLRPSFIMLPFHLISETSRNLALAIRLFGNIMSGTIIVGILLAIAPLFFPLLLQALGLLIGLIQAYIFAVLAMVYIAAAVQSQREQEGETNG